MDKRLARKRRMIDKRKVNLEDRMKHIIQELNVINIMTQLAMADLQHYMRDKNELNGGDDD